MPLLWLKIWFYIKPRRNTSSGIKFLLQVLFDNVSYPTLLTPGSQNISICGNPLQCWKYQGEINFLCSGTRSGRRKDCQHQRGLSSIHKWKSQAVQGRGSSRLIPHVGTDYSIGLRYSIKHMLDPMQATLAKDMGSIEPRPRLPRNPRTYSLPT